MKKIVFIFAIFALTACVKTPTNINGTQEYFAFDSAEITRDAQRGLEAQARYMKKHPEANVILGGHCDERGSTEYNLALGALRAGNAAHVLIRDGIESKRIKTISYGKENPQYKGTGEEVWAKNRNVTTDIAK